MTAQRGTGEARAAGAKTITALIGMLCLVMAGPATAQFSKSYKFLDAVRTKDGQTVTDEVNKPGSTLINTRDATTGQTALHIVIARRDESWLAFLLSKGADPNLPDFKGLTPLGLASSMGFSEAVGLLVGSGARVDEPDATGETPLIAAVHRRDLAMMRVLLQAGANPDRADSSGRSARDYARLEGGSSAVLATIEANAKARRSGPAIYGPRL